MSLITIANSRNDAVISGNHHQSVGSGTPRSSHGITPNIITTKASPKTARITVCWPDIVAVASSPLARKRASLSALGSNFFQPPA